MSIPLYNLNFSNPKDKKKGAVDRQSNNHGVHVENPTVPPYVLNSFAQQNAIYQQSKIHPDGIIPPSHIPLHSHHMFHGNPVHHHIHAPPHHPYQMPQDYPNNQFPHASAYQAPGASQNVCFVNNLNIVTNDNQIVQQQNFQNFLNQQNNYFYNGKSLGSVFLIWNSWLNLNKLSTGLFLGDLSHESALIFFDSTNELKLTPKTLAHLGWQFTEIQYRNTLICLEDFTRFISLIPLSSLENIHCLRIVFRTT